jgi:metallopeptidase MepB
MAKTPETVMKFLDDLKTRVVPYRSRDINELLQVKKADLEAQGVSFDDKDKYYAWDNAYYGRLLKEQKYSVDQIEVSQYFPLQYAVSEMLKLFGELFGLVFVEIKGEDQDKLSPTKKGSDIVWHEDATLFSVWNDVDSKDSFAGYLYLDLHPRLGKYGHAAKFSLVPGYRREDGSRQYPVAAILANFTKPTAEKPSLLRHSEVVTLFHEIGHGIHDLVTRTTYSEFHNGVARDFVEAPSQMLENWCWITAPLQRFSSHYKTGEPIPEDLADRIVRAKHVGEALAILGQLRYCYLDMTVHTRKPGDEEIDIAAYYNEKSRELTGIDGPEALGEPRYVEYAAPQRSH